MTSDVSNAPVEPAAFSNEKLTELAVLQSEQSELLTERVDQLERWRWRLPADRDDLETSHKIESALRRAFDLGDVLENQI